MTRFGSIVTLFIMCITNSAFAANTAVFPVSGTNLEPGEMDVIGLMIADAYEKHSRQSVLRPRATRAAAEASKWDLPTAARSLGVSQYLWIKALKLTTVTSIQVTLYNVDGRHIHRVSVTASSLDDMQAASDRIALALVNRMSLDATRNVDNVTITETKAKNRTFVEKVLGVKTSAIWPVDFTHRYDPSISLSFDGRLEAKHYFLEFGAGILLPPDMGDSNRQADIGGLISEIGISYYLASTSISPYIGAGLLPRLLFLDQAKYGHDTEAGANMAVYAQAGLMFMRESSSRIYLDFRVGQNVVPWSYACDDYYDYYVTSEECSNATSGDYFPTEFTLLAGIGW